MLTQHFKFLTPKLPHVKFMTAAVIATTAVMLAPMTAQASTGLAKIETTKYSAKFDRAMFENKADLQRVYETLQKKADKACRIGRAIDRQGEIMSKAECVTDLLGQFIESADVTTLTIYHLDMTKMDG